MPDGKLRGEERGHDCVGGSVVAQGFGKDQGDRLRYRLRLARPFSNALLIWRFRLRPEARALFQIDGAYRGEIAFQGSGEFATAAVPLGALRAGECELNFTSKGGEAPALNGFALLEAEQADLLRFVKTPWRPVPGIGTVPDTNGLVLKYQDVSNYYGFSLATEWAGRRQLKWRDLDAAFGNHSDAFTRQRIFGDPRRGRPGDPDSLFIHAFSKPFSLAPNSSKSIYGVVCAGSDGKVRRCLAEFQPQSPAHERVYLAGKESAYHLVSTPAGEGYLLGQQLMSAVTLTNLTYPLYTQRNYIRTYSPGRIWDCLYTWDAGFVGLGLLETDPQGAVDLLNAYTTPEGAQSAFIHHGTPLPIQIYLYCELCNRTQSREMLEYFYSRLRQYHRFLAGRLGSSTTRQHQDHLICTWDYFYNTGGWDDYPPQKFVHQHNLTSAVAPVVNSAHTIRCAKLLRAAAAALGRDEDFAEYDRDVQELSASLQRYSWDAPSGYYGYVRHDRQGAPDGILRDAGGMNFNMGLDGVYPLVAGICSQQQEQRILEHLFSPQHLWTAAGITTVDQSASYYNPNGYWNGSVWFAHQWFLWKTMLDLGRGELAKRIALAGLEIWKQVTDASYDCMEHFTSHKPYGAGWSQFSSLSSPVLPWFASLYTPGRLTCGFDVWIRHCSFSQSNRRLQARLKLDRDQPGRQFSVLACMNPDSSYTVQWNGAAVEFTKLHDGLLQIQLPCRSGAGDLSIRDTATGLT